MGWRAPQLHRAFFGGVVPAPCTLGLYVSCLGRALLSGTTRSGGLQPAGKPDLPLLS